MAEKKPNQGLPAGTYVPPSQAGPKAYGGGGPGVPGADDGCVLDASEGEVCGAASACRPGQDKRAKFPTSKAPFSAVFHSFRLIFGRAIISRNDLEAWMLSPERARAEHSR